MYETPMFARYAFTWVASSFFKITASFDLKYRVSLTSLMKLVYTNQKKMSIHYSFSYSRYLSYYPYWYKCYSPFIRQNIFYRRGHSRNGQERWTSPSQNRALPWFIPLAITFPIPPFGFLMLLKNCLINLMEQPLVFYLVSKN